MGKASGTNLMFWPGLQGRVTSADAEPTDTLSTPRTGPSGHLCGRGANHALAHQSWAIGGAPPRRGANRHRVLYLNSQFGAPPRTRGQPLLTCMVRGALPFCYALRQARSFDRDLSQSWDMHLSHSIGWAGV